VGRGLVADEQDVHLASILAVGRRGAMIWFCASGS
jgi:hypothetical protein